MDATQPTRSSLIGRLHSVPDAPPRTWHARASIPLGLWAVVAVIVILWQLATGGPDWLSIHALALGVITNAVVVWSQLLSERYIQAHPSTGQRLGHLGLLGLLNVGVLGVLVGVSVGAWVLTFLGAALMGLALVGHAAGLLYQRFTAGVGKRFRHIVTSYAVACLWLPAVAGAGVWLDSPGASPEALLQAHAYAAVFGFVGIAAFSSLVLLFPAVWRTRGAGEYPLWVLSFQAVGLAVACAGALAGQPWLVRAGFVGYLGAVLYLAKDWLWQVINVAKQPRDRITFASASLAAAVVWIIGILGYVLVTASSVPIAPAVLGFAAQLLLGVLAAQLIGIVGGSGSAKRAGLYVFDTLGLTRVVLTNGGLIFWLANPGSLIGVISQWLAFGALSSFVPLAARAIWVQRQVNAKTRTAPVERQGVRWSQVLLGMGMLTIAVSLGALLA